MPVTQRSTSPVARVDFSRHLSGVIALPTLTYRTIDLLSDADRAIAHHRDACIATYGDDSRFQGAARYLRSLCAKIEEFPDGHVLAYLEDQCVGQLELEVPYGKAKGYASLFYVTPEFRGRGFGRRIHEYAERYFRAWEAKQIELNVSPRNERAVGFYRAMGYRLVEVDPIVTGLWTMRKTLE